MKPGAAFADVSLNGTLSNGTLEEDGGTLSVSASGVVATLSGMTLASGLSLSSAVSVTGGLAVATAAGGQPGTLTVSSGGINVLDNETLSTWC